MRSNKPLKAFRDVIYRLRQYTFKDDLNKNVRWKLAIGYLWWFVSYKYFGRKYKIRLQNGMKSVVHPYPDHDAGEANIFTKNVDYFDIEFVRKNLKKGDYIIDAGCNVGNRTIVLADIIKGAMMIDPTIKAIERVKENLVLNNIDLSNYVFINKAVSNKPGVMGLVEHGGASTQNFIIEGNNQKNGPQNKITEVDVVTIDQLVKRFGMMPVYIKIDVEGFDFKVIQGAVKTLKSGVKLVRFENNIKELIPEIKSFFESINYRLFVIDKNGLPAYNYSGLLKSTNIFASPVSQKLEFSSKSKN